MEEQEFPSLMQESSENNYSLALQTNVACEEDYAAQFVCRLCKKTFYNANALQNHRNMQHDVGPGSSGSEDGELEAAALGDQQTGMENS